MTLSPIARTPYICLAFILLAYVIGWNIHVMEIDAAQYAALSMEMVQNGNFLEIYLRGENYLDKPPLTFWLAAASFSLFGQNDIAYRIPNFLFTLLAFVSTFRFARLYYDQLVSWLAVLILGSTQAFFLMNHDCRTDTILTGAMAFSVWQLAAYLQHNRWKYIIGSGVGIGLSLLTKGPIGLVIPILAFGPHIVLQRNFKSILDWKWVIVFSLAGAMLLPMCLGLYQQHGMYGLRFYFWIQSFGRITGESSWDNGTGYFFLLQNHLWSFSPFIFFFFPAMYQVIKKIILHKFLLTPDQEAISFFGFVLPFIVFSTSHYQLPHYIFVLYPFAAIFTANYIIHIYQSLSNKILLNVLQFILLTGYVMLVVYLIFFCFIGVNYLSMLYFISGGGILIWWIRTPKYPIKTAYLSILLYTWVNLGLNGIVYPTLLTYQTGSEAALKARKLGLPAGKITSFMTDGGYAMDFYLRKIIPKNMDMEYPVNNNLSGTYMYTNQTGLDKVKNSGYSIDTVYAGDEYHVTTLTPKFLNPATRNETVERRYLLALKK